MGTVGETQDGKGEAVPAAAVDGATASDASTEAGGGIGDQVRQGLRWSMLNNAITKLGTLALGMAVARLVSPANFGQFAVALVVLAGLLSVNEAGVSLAIIRWPGPISRIAPTVTTIALLGSSLVTGVALLTAGTVAAALGSPEAAPVVRVLALSALLDGCTSVPAAQLTREFRQRERAGIDLTALVVTAVTTLWLASAGLGAMSLACGRLAGNLISIPLFLRAVDRVYLPRFDRHVAFELLRFGMPLAGASLLVFVMLNIDYAIVGSSLGPTQLGLYLLAFNLSSWPVTMFSEAVRRVSLSAFSRLAEGGVVPREPFERALGLMLAAALPVCALLGLLAEPLVHVAYGKVWTAAAPALSFLALLAAARVTAELAYDVLVALGRSGSTLAVQIVWTVLLGPALTMGVRADGIRGVALAHAAVAWLVAIPLYAVLLRRCGFSILSALRGVRWPVTATCCLALVVLAWLRVDAPPVLAVVLGGVLGMLGYGVAIWPMRAQLLAVVGR